MVRTVFGWTVNGPLGRKRNYARHTINFIRRDAQLEKQFKKFCETEFGDPIVGTTQMSRDSLKAIEIMDQSTVLKEDHYQMHLPWRSAQPSLPNNRTSGKHRLKVLKMRFRKDTELFQRYSSVIDEHL